jgi:hypothetical protein
MASIDKILIGSPTYKQLVGNVTRVHKVVTGIPLTSVTIGPYADIDNIVGVDTTGKTEGSLLSYDSDTGNFSVSQAPTIEVDGKTYPSDSAHTNILIRRSGTQGEPLILQQGELAYSYLSDPSTNGFGNGGDRLYIAIGDNDVDGNSTEIDVIGGTYFTNLMNHQQGLLKPNSALLTDANSRLDKLLADSAEFIKVTATNAFFDVTTTPIIESPIISLRSNATETGLFFRAAGDSATKVFHQGGEVFQTQAFGDTGAPGNSKLVGGQGLRLNFENNFLVNKGLTFLDSTFVTGDVEIVGNLEVIGTTTYLNTKELLIQDKRIVIARGVPNALAANNSGIAVGDSDTPIATITYKNNGVDSACWDFNPGICAPSITVTDLKFETIDCGIYSA